MRVCIRLLFVLLCLFFTKANAQQSANHQYLNLQNPIDSINTLEFKEGYQGKLYEHLNKYKQHKRSNLQRKKLNELEHFEERLSNYLKYGLDTSDIVIAIQTAEEGYQNALDGISESGSTMLSSRDLAASQYFLIALSSSLGGVKKKLEQRIKVIDAYQMEYDSLVGDSMVYQIPSDQEMYERVAGELLNINEKLLPDFSNLMQLQNTLQKLRVQVNFINDRIDLSLAEIDKRRDYLSEHISERELPNIWEGDHQSGRFVETVSLAMLKERNLLLYYLYNNRVLFISILIIGLLFHSILKRIIFSIRKEGAELVYGSNPVFQKPALSLIFIFSNLSQFLFFHSPFVFQGTMWFISWLVLIWFNSKEQKPFSDFKKFNWFIYLYPFVFFDNLMLVPFRGELWLMLVLCMVTIAFIVYYWQSEGRFLPRKMIRNFGFGFLLFVEFSAIFFVLFGRYNLAKILMVSGYIGIFGGLLLYHTKELWFYFLQITNGSKDNYFQNRFLFNLRKVSENSKPIIHFLYYLGITIVIFRNYYFYAQLLNELEITLSEERFIGKYAYNWYAVLTFFGVILFTLLISKIITILFEDKWYDHKGESQKGGLKNWALIVKLIILLLGFFLAFAAAGVPMDSLTLIIGSLGLGIGFGLQGIVGNLISGVVIAFERPFEINDQVEWNNQLGRISDIGLRSSKIANTDGSEIVVPNSDLLNQKLINWTHSNNLRRIEVVVGLSYKADLGVVKAALEELLENIELVKRYPEPMILMDVFSDSSIHCRILCWVNVHDMLNGRSEVIMEVHKMFAEKGIEIPYPQLDIHKDKIE